MKDHTLDSQDSGISNPYRVLLYGTSGQHPHMRSTLNIWHHTQVPVIEAEVQCLVLLERVISHPEVFTLHEHMAKKFFSLLGEDERKEWGIHAKEEYDVAIETWKNEIQADPSEEPAAHQKYV